MNRESIIAAAENLARDHMDTYKDVSHDWHHVNRVRRLSLHIAKMSGPDKKLDLFAIEIGALFHDVCDHKYMPAEMDSAAYLHEKFFMDHPSVPKDIVELITFIAGGVSWTKEIKRSHLPRNEVDDRFFSCLELHCVQDADKLESMGAIGVLRCAAYSQSAGHMLVTVPNLPNERSSQEHFHEKLLQIKDRLVTPEGVKLGEARHAFMADFIRQLELEVQI